MFKKFAVKWIRRVFTFALLALFVCIGCGVCAVASGGGISAAVCTLAAVVGCNEVLGVLKALK